MIQQETAKAGLGLVFGAHGVAERVGKLPRDGKIGHCTVALELGDWDIVLAALRLLEPVAAGTHVIVPREPTAKMLVHGRNESGNYSDAAIVYRAMIAAAQEETP
jgi:hypothetical protein